jgi:hypothetical protein
MTGRPSDYTEDLAAAICVRLSDGESLKGICADTDMPGRSTVFRWLAAHERFRDMYARAREDQADTLADEIVGISDESEVTTKMDGEEVRLNLDATAVARNRLRVDARKWVAAKLKPRKYGERQVLAGDPDAPIETITRIKLADLE